MEKEKIKEYLKQVSEQVETFRDSKIELEETYKNTIKNMIDNFNLKLELNDEILEIELNELSDIVNNYDKLISDTDFVMKQIINSK